MFPRNLQVIQYIYTPQQIDLPIASLLAYYLLLLLLLLCFLTMLSNQRGSMEDLMPCISYCFLTTNCMSTIYKAYVHDDYVMVAFIIYVYIGLFMLDRCLTAFHHLPPRESSPKKTFLKFAIWFLTSSILFGFVCEFAPLFSVVGAVALFAIVVVGCSGLFYVYFFLDDKPASEESSGKKMEFVSDQV